MIFAYSDVHFFHKNILRFCDRPFDDLKHMHYVIINNWNRVVSNNDTIIFNGDFDFCGIERSREIVSQLNGYKVLIRGNHDDNRRRMLLKGFNEVYDELKFNHNGYDFIFSHYPYYPTEEEIKDLIGKGVRLKSLEKRPIKRNDPSLWLIHGHVHNTWGKINRERQMVNVSCDVWDFTPPSLDVDIINLIKLGD